MLSTKKPLAPVIVAALLFLALAPIAVDTYNSLNQRAFLDLVLRGNPFTLALSSRVQFGAASWPLDWPYPPLTMLLILPAWGAFRLTHSEAAYQLLFKLPLFACAVATQALLLRLLAAERPRSSRMVAAQYYVVNPGIVLLTTVAGGFDVVAGLLILLAIFYARSRRWVAAALALGVAGALRLYPLALVPVLLVHQWRAGTRKPGEAGFSALAAFAPLLASCIPFLASDAAGFFRTLASQQGV